MLAATSQTSLASPSVRRQCQLLGLSRSSLCYEAATDYTENLCLMRLIDEEYTARRLTERLVTQGRCGD
jgi:putative transposase